MILEEQMGYAISQISVALDLDRDGEARLKHAITQHIKANANLSFHGAVDLLGMLVHAYMERPRDDS